MCASFFVDAMVVGTMVVLCGVCVQVVLMIMLAVFRVGTYDVRTDVELERQFC